jgi:tyrosine-specific transport protein
MGVALSLSDFLIDGLKIKKTWEGRLLAIFLTFIPPLIFVFSYERGFLMALEYAGVFVAILLIALPSAMAWRLDSPKFYKSKRGRALLITTTIFSFFVIAIDILIHLKAFDHILGSNV